MHLKQVVPCLGVTLALAASSCSSSGTASSQLPTTISTGSTPGATGPVPTAAAAASAPSTTTSLASMTTPSRPAAESRTAATVDTVLASTTSTASTASTSSTADPTVGAERAVVEFLAADALAGRDNLTPGSAAAQAYLLGELKKIGEPLVSGTSGDAGFEQKFALGTNLFAVIPGGDLADQYVIVGAHYDHLGSTCGGVSAKDSICNGATDNATGVAAALSVGRSIAADPTPPRRSVIIALWDAEEDQLAGSAAYIAHPLVPLDHTIGYVNFDIQGADLLPSLRGSTVMVGAETGGPNLIAAATMARKASTLVTLPLSLLFGQGRSDHANFTAAGVPSVFFTDATSACYHTVADEASIVDYPKLEQETKTAEALTRNLMDTDAVPVDDKAAPAAAYSDAISMLYTVSHAEADFGEFTSDNRTKSERFLRDLHAIVDAGPSKFTPDFVGTLLSGSLDYVTALATGTCHGYLAAQP